MRMTLLIAVLVSLSGLAQDASAQGFGIAGRAGTVGIGVEGALGLSPNLVVRGGLALMPFEFDATIDDIDFTLELPDSWYNIGFDFYPAGGFRIGGGMLFRSDDPEITGTLSGSATIEIGDVTYTADQVSEIQGFLISKDSAPYVLIGFGKHTSSGVGLFVDLGVAFMGDGEVELDATGDPAIVGSPEFQAELRKEEANLEDDIGTYTKYWPILNIGLRIGLGN